MIRFLTFLIVFVAMGVYLYRLSGRSLPSIKVKKKQLSKSSSPGILDEFWVQIYDTDSSEDAKRIQKRLLDLGIHCMVYSQGKKDIFGDVPKHYGLSVPKASVEKAQRVVSQIAF